MMIFRFKDNGASAPDFRFGAEPIEFDDDRLFAKEAIKLEQITGRQIAYLSKAFYQDRETEATMAFLWLALYRLHGDAAGRFTDLNPDITQMEIVTVAPDVVAPDEDQAAAEHPPQAVESPESTAEPQAVPS